MRVRSWPRMERRLVETEPKSMVSCGNNCTVLFSYPSLNGCHDRVAFLIVNIPPRIILDFVATDEHELVPGFALQAVFAFLRSQHGLITKTRTSAQSGSKSATSTNGSINGSINSSSVQKPDSTGSRDVRHDWRVMRLQNEKANRTNNNDTNAMTNAKTTTTAARSTTPSGEPRRGRGRPRKLR